MKTTLELPDDLYRKVKSKAAIDGVRMTDVVIRGLRMALAESAPRRNRVSFPLIPAKRGAAAITSQQIVDAETNAVSVYR